MGLIQTVFDHFLTIFPGLFSEPVLEVQKASERRKMKGEFRNDYAKSKELRKIKKPLMIYQIAMSFIAMGNFKITLDIRKRLWYNGL